jgi:hypothetical protein
MLQSRETGKHVAFQPSGTAGVGDVVLRKRRAFLARRVCFEWTLLRIEVEVTPHEQRRESAQKSEREQTEGSSNKKNPRRKETEEKVETQILTHWFGLKWHRRESDLSL